MQMTRECRFFFFILPAVRLSLFPDKVLLKKMTNNFSPAILVFSIFHFFFVALFCWWIFVCFVLPRHASSFLQYNLFFHSKHSMFLYLCYICEHVWLWLVCFFLLAQMFQLLREIMACFFSVCLFYCVYVSLAFEMDKRYCCCCAHDKINYIHLFTLARITK